MNSEGHNEAHDSPNTLAFESKCRQCNVYKNILDSGDNEQKTGAQSAKCHGKNAMPTDVLPKSKVQ